MVSYEHTYSFSDATASQTLSSWATIFLKIFRDMTTAVLQPPSGYSSNNTVEGYKVIVADHTDYDYYQWTVLFQDMNIDSPIHFKLSNTTVVASGNTVTDEQNNMVNPPFKLWMAYSTNDELAWIPILEMPGVVSNIGGWANDSNHTQYHYLHTVETEYGDIFVQGYIRWVKLSTMETVEPSSSSPSDRILPLFALVHGANRTDSSDTNMLCLGFLAPTDVYQSNSEYTIRSFSLPLLNKKESTTATTSLGGISMYPLYFVAPDVNPNLEIGLHIDRQCCETAIRGLDGGTSSSLSTANSIFNYFRLPINPGPLRATLQNGTTSPTIKTQMMVPIISPYSLYIPQYCGVLLFSDTWKKGEATFNGKQYIFIDNFGMRLTRS